MLRFLTPAWRKARKSPGYTIVNILGLTIGFSIGFLIFSYLRFETSYDRFYDDYEHIYRLGAEYNIGGNIDRFCNIARPVGPALKRDMADVAAQTRVLGYNGLNQHKAFFNVDDRQIKSDHVFVVDSSFFDVFEVSLLAGSSADPLSTPASIVLTESLAHRLFGSQSALNQTIELDGEIKVNVTGIIAKNSNPTHLPYEALLSWDLGARPGEENVWIGWHTYTYLKLEKNYSPENLKADFPAFAEKYMAETMTDFGANVELILQPLASIHLNSDLTWEAYPNNNLYNIYILSVVGLFLLLIAVINYVNLATARVTERSREVGIRKVLGSSRKALVIQFLTESVLVTISAALVGIVLVVMLFSAFQELASQTIGIAAVFNAINLVIYLITVLFIGVLAGLYPALYMSGIGSSAILKGKYLTSGKGILLRKILITVQFAASIGVIISSIIVVRQLDFISSSDLGFDKGNMMVISIKNDPSQSSIESLMARLNAHPAVLGTSVSASVPGQELNQTFFEIPDSQGEYNSMGGQFMEIENNFIRLIGMNILKGRDFIYSSSSERDRSLLLNESAAKSFGWSNDPIGKKIGWGTDSLGNRQLFEVVGMVEDFHVGSMHDQIPPIAIFLSFGDSQNLFVRLHEEQIGEGINFITSQWSHFDPKFPIEYNFLDQNFDDFYTTEAKLYQLLEYISIIILIISGMGLLGLVSFSVNIRKREISIRRVLGSEIKDIYLLLSKEYVIVIAVSFLLGGFAGWYFLDQWLSNFHYRVYFAGWEFLLALAGVVIVVFLVMSTVTIRATKENPSSVLRTD